MIEIWFNYFIEKLIYKLITFFLMFKLKMKENKLYPETLNELFIPFHLLFKIGDVLMLLWSAFDCITEELIIRDIFSLWNVGRD